MAQWSSLSLRFAMISTESSAPVLKNLPTVSTRASIILPLEEVLGAKESRTIDGDMGSQSTQTHKPGRPPHLPDPADPPRKLTEDEIQHLRQIGTSVLRVLRASTDQCHLHAPSPSQIQIQSAMSSIPPTLSHSPHLERIPSSALIPHHTNQPEESKNLKKEWSAPDPSDQRSSSIAQRRRRLGRLRGADIDERMSTLAEVSERASSCSVV